MRETSEFGQEVALAPRPRWDSSGESVALFAMWRMDFKRARSPYLVGLLVTTAVLVVLLAGQAWVENVYHRETTGAVLRDDAALAADEALRRIAVEVGYSGYRPAMSSLRELHQSTGVLSDLDEL